jgi:allantoinase
VKWPDAPGVVRGRSVVTPEGVRPASVHIDAGRITRIGDYDDTGTPGQDVLDARGLCVLPGLVDTHVHVNEPGRAEWEGFATATAAAAAGGITTLLDMPLNSIPATTNARALARKRRYAEGKCRVDVGFLGGVVPANDGEVASLWEAGVFGFKCFLVPSGVDEFRHVSADDLERAMPVIAAIGAPLMVHAELQDPLDDALAGLRSEDPCRYSTYLASRPAIAETDAIRLVIGVAQKHRARAHIVHVSAAESVALLLEARATGVSITAETCPHYLAIRAHEIPDGATEFKCAPPIRDETTRLALWDGLQQGALDFIVSDHSPCPPNLKRKDAAGGGNFFEAWGGIASLELTLAVAWTEMRQRKIDVANLARWMCAAPAEFAGLQGRKGSIASSSDADLTIVNLDDPFVVDARTLQQRHKVTPYDRRELYGRVCATYLRGALVYGDGKLVGEPSGRLLSRGS